LLFFWASADLDLNACDSELTAGAEFDVLDILVALGNPEKNLTGCCGFRPFLNFLALSKR